MPAHEGHDSSRQPLPGSSMGPLGPVGADHHASTDGAGPYATTTESAPVMSEVLGTRIGPYKLLQLIGEGGFGSVYMAEQEKPVLRKVALKIIKLGMDTHQVIARFEAERQALAMMDHPHIARVLDAGATDSGRPFFVMDLVKGEPITAYCDRHSLSIDKRLELFAQVCNAVQHAHTKGIIHRDVKPSNVLVSTLDGRPCAKVIDFGIAKATTSKLTEKTLFTQHNQLIGTLEYMSPEQAEGSLDIDTRTDVYSLGVLLYELLTGSTPFDSSRLRSAAYAEIQRIIREVEPPVPSARISQSSETLSAVAAHRHVEPARLGPLVRGELDWIVMKALDKDRARRYETANSLGDDIARFRTGQAVVAAPPGVSYRFKKFIRRNRSMVSAGGAVAGALLMGVAAFAWQAKVARAQRDIAVRSQVAEAEQRKAAEASMEAESKARKRAEEINVFVTKTLRLGDSLAGGAADATIAQAMEKAIKEIDAGAFKDDPETEVRLRATIASILQHNNRPAEAGQLLPGVMEVVRRALSSDDPNVPANRTKWIEMWHRFWKADPDATFDLESIMRMPGALALMAKGEPFLVEALAVERRRWNGDHEDVARGLTQLASLRSALGRPAEAEPLLVEALEMERRIYEGDHRRIVGSLAFLATVRTEMGRAADAEPLAAEALEMHRRLAPNDSELEMGLLNDLATLRLALGRAAEAEPMLLQALEKDRRLFKGSDFFVAITLNNLARARQAMGRAVEARQGFDEAIAVLRRQSPGGSAVLARVLWRSGSARLENTDSSAALPELNEAVSMAEKVLHAEHPHLKAYRETLAACETLLAKPPGPAGAGPPK